MVAGAVAVFAPIAATGQVVEGRIIDADTRHPVLAARVVVLHRGGGAIRSAFTDSAGLFRIAVPWPGRYRLQSEALGYARSTSGPLDLLPDDTVEIELGLTVEPIPLAPLVVISDRPALVFDERLERRGYYERKAMLNDLGAHFLEHAEIQRRHPWSIEGALQSLPGVRVRPVGGRDVAVTNLRGQPLSLCLDGSRVGSLSGRTRIHHFVPMSFVVAIEVYPSAASRGWTRCSVMVWTGIPPDPRGSQ